MGMREAVLKAGDISLLCILSIANYPVRDILFHFPRSPAALGNAPASSKASRILPAIYSLLHTVPLTISR
jgi:hypothetical protein